MSGDLPPIKVLVVEDHPLTQAGLRSFLAAFPDLLLLGMVDSGESAIRFCAQTEPDVILMDLIMPGMDGVTATRAIKERHANIKVIVLTNSDDSATINDALQAGASNYLLKTSSAFELASAIRAAQRRA